LGYELRASFALFWYAINHFDQAGLKYLNLGSGAGAHPRNQDGLSRFKAGWANGTKTVYFCGRIFDQERYSKITQSKGIVGDDYFPAYRSSEFLDRVNS
jgi:hypothetical protein